MNLREIAAAARQETDALHALWEKSVRATHRFLSENDIVKISEYVPKALSEVQKLIVAEDAHSVPMGFIGIENNRIEMLFVSPENIGCGIGRILVRYAIDNYHVSEVCVNEENVKARGFYERMGFETYRRTEFDEQGGPFPLLYMKLKTEH